MTWHDAFSVDDVRSEIGPASVRLRQKSCYADIGRVCRRRFFGSFTYEGVHYIRVVCVKCGAWSKIARARRASDLE